MKVNWYYGTVLLGEPMRKNKPYYPDMKEVQHSRNVLRENVKYGIGGASRLTEDDLHVLDRYIEFLENHLGSLTDQYQGIPSEHFTARRRDLLECKPRRHYEETPYMPFK
ncbi:hypothetical protein EVB68_097 [Rhizobium phage RHph_Y2_6]|uniref:Uncharacterized protein n=1 Tax=Rhizobium phage RHph_Y2_6 TaxID=2509576 RepID=A0A7S5QZF6_9CAUD|nr:hypothetical protein PP748_gp099 [Rhizobium phage RHph_Y2_6]QIG68832.1 hypothetical protein EVB68_097 [Rhizobium phage RHph_Y2_6]